MAALVLAACGALPRPFAPDSKQPAWGDPLRPADGAGVVVAAPEGAGDGGDGLGEAVAAALRRLEVPASAGGGNRASLWLTGSAAASGEGDALVVRWTLSSPDGTLLGAFEQRVGAAVLREGAAPMLAEETARRVAHLLGREAGAATAARAPEMIVPPVAGAPGDGAASLTSAMVLALKGAGAALAAEPGDETLLVLGSVSVSPVAPGLERVEVLWEVIEPDGRRLGVVSQRNTLEEGMLDGPWGAIAATIATGGAEGVLDLVARTARR